MEQYCDLPHMGSLMQEVETLKQKIEDHEMTFNTLA